MRATPGATECTSGVAGRRGSLSGVAEPLADKNDDEVEVVGEPAPTAPYVFEPADVATAVELVDVGFADLDHAWGTVRRLTDAAKAKGIDGTALVLELIHAAGHELCREPGGKAGCDLGRDLDHELLGWPRPIAAAPEPALELWRAVAAGATAPAAVARFEDLLFARRDSNGRDRVRRAAAGYLAAVDAAGGELEDIDMHGVDALLRVWSLARSVREEDIDDDVRSRMADIVTKVLASMPGARPGAALPLLRALAAGPLRAGTDPHDVDALLERAATVYQRGDLALQIAADRRSRAAGDAATLEAIARDEVAAYFAEADAAAEAAVRMHHLEAAAQVATKRGLGELARKAASLMQQIKPSDLGLKRIRVETSIPKWVPESFLSQFTHGTSWREGLGYFFAGHPPSGSIDQVRKVGRGSRGVLMSLTPTTFFGAGGLPRTTTKTDADREAEDMSRSAGLSARFYGEMLAVGLHRMAARYGTPSVDELVGAIVDEGCRDPQLAVGLAKGFKHFWDGDYESSIAVVIPKFEAAARSLLRELDEGIYRVQRGNDPGGYVGLYVLLDELEKLALDPSWTYFFRWLLLSPYGANLRNDVAHGFVFDPGPIHTALTLRAVSVLALVAGPLPDDSFAAEKEDENDGSYDGGGEATEVRVRPREEVLGHLAYPTGPAPVGWRLAAAVGDRLERAAWWIRGRSTRAAARRRSGR